VQAAERDGPLTAVVLAAGYGRRMRPLSDSCHKALLPLGGTTILGRIMDSLQAAGVQRVLVVTGYRERDVREFLARSHPQANCSFVHNEQFATTNNVVSLALALDALGAESQLGDVLLIECDLIFDPQLLISLAARPSGNVALVDRYRQGMDGTVVSVGGGVVSAVFAPSAQGEHFNYSDKFKTLNIYRFTEAFCRDILGPSVRRHAREVDSNAYYELVLARLVDLPGQRIAAQVVDGSQWTEVDDPNDLSAARFAFEPAHRAQLLDRAHGGYWNLDLLDFAHIRNARFPTPAMLAALAYALPELVTGYGSAQAILNEKLSWFIGAPASRLTALNGAAQAMPIFARLFEGRRTALPSPTFGEYPRLFAADRSYRDLPAADLDLLEEIAADVELFVAVNPNNPSGAIIPTQALHELAGRHPATTFLVDESFQCFSAEESLLARLEREPLENVVVLTSLSKALGVPGLRLGYLYSADRLLLERVATEIPIWNLNAPAEHFLELLLKFRPEFERSLAQTRDDREALAASLAALAIVARVHPSAANFLLVTLADGAPSAAAMRDELLRGSPAINVREVSARFADGGEHLRIAVRMPQENARLLDALARVQAPGR
jgi:histidinol-phosphate/aromatic aminotransferase/cobyric acid decarboxylase-like protein/choline kinase